MTDTHAPEQLTTVYRAAWMLPVASPPIEGGALAVAGDRIAAVGPAAQVLGQYPGAEVVDLGASIVLPGFVNCHSHLEYTAFRGILDDAEFGDWILQLVEIKASLSADEYLESARLGAAETVSSGITTVADVSYSGVPMKAAAEAGLRGRLYLEVSGVDDARLDDTMADVDGARRRRASERDAAARRRPHAARPLHRVGPPLPGRLGLRARVTA